MESNSIGEVIRVEWNDETDEVRLVILITDQKFKRHVLSSKSFQDVLAFDGKNVMVVASKSKNE